MKLLSAHCSLASVIIALLSTAHLASAVVLPRGESLIQVTEFDPRETSTTSPIPPASSGLVEGDESLQNSTHLELRAACDGTLCGYYQQLCCHPGTVCYTDANNQAQCGTMNAVAALAVTAGSGNYQVLTATYVSTNLLTYTTVYTIGVAATGATCAAGRTTCGISCCNPASESCINGVCVPFNGFTTEGATQIVTASGGVRPTSVTTSVATRTVSGTKTTAFVPAVTAGGVNGTAEQQTSGGGGLSGGAIAGIVIGVIAAIIILFLICLCCCLKAGFDGLLAILGLGKKKEKRTIVEEEYMERRRHGSRYGSAAYSADGRRWHGSDRPGRPPPSRIDDKKKAGGIAALLGLGGIAAALGMKKKAEKDEKSDYSSSYYSDLSTSYTDSRSDDRYTHRDSRRGGSRRDSRSRYSDRR